VNSNKCQAMVLTAPNQLEMQTFELPELVEEDGLLKLELAGVCGSDPSKFKGGQTYGPRPYPLILGHEIVGRVAQMGNEAQKRHRVKEGDRVVIEYAFGCGVCEPCVSGDYTMCTKHYNYGSMISCKNSPHLFGAYSEYLYIHPNAKVHYIGDDISPELGVMICAVIANGVRWLRHIGNVSIGDTVVIVGPGQQGLAGIAAAKESGAGPIFAIGLKQDRERLEMAWRFGCDEIIVIGEDDPVEKIAKATGGKMANLVMDTSGSPQGAQLALSLTGIKGSLVLPGIYKHQLVPLDLDMVVTREIKMLGVLSHNSQAVHSALKIAKNYPFEELISHRFPLSDLEKAIKLTAGDIKEEKMPLKVVIDPTRLEIKYDYRAINVKRKTCCYS
jgi:alcohol dehydrogenase